MAWIENVIERKARKRWRCQGDGARPPRHAPGCPEVIEPGARMIEYVGETPMYQSGSRHSLACATAFYQERT